MKKVSLPLLLLLLVLLGAPGAPAKPDSAKPDTSAPKPKPKPRPKKVSRVAPAPAGSIFIDRRGTVEGCAGDLHVSFDKSRGGVFSVLRGHGLRTKPLGTVGARLEVTTREDGETIPAGTKIVIKQENDRAPDFYYLEEGNLRCGVRVMFQLLDDDGTYYGDGMQEVWLYPSGELYASLYARIQDRRSVAKIHGGWLDLAASDTFSKISAGSSKPKTYDMAALTKGVSIPFGEKTLPGKYVAFENPQQAMLFSWFKDSGRVASSFSGAYDKIPGPPNYRKWPHAIDQYGPRTGFGVSKTARLALSAAGDKTRARFVFENEPKGVRNTVNYSIGAIYGLSVGKTTKDLVARAAARRALFDKKSVLVKNGEFCFFNDMENGYEVFKAGAEKPAVVTFPADLHARAVTLTVYGLTKHGGVEVLVDGKQVPIQLASDGGLPDDPLVPVKEPPHAPAQQVTFAVQLNKDKPTTATVREVPGVQLVYQRRHPLRVVAIFTSRHTRKRAGMEFSLLDGVARHLTGWGNTEYAATENFLYWFRNCSYSRHEYPDHLRDFVVEQSGPEKVVFKYRSTTFNNRVFSQFTITIPYDAPIFMFNAKARFEVAQFWGWNRNQFFDMFPFRGVYPEDWWWEEVLYMNDKNEWGITLTTNKGKKGPPAPKMTNRSFYGFYSAARGNVLVLAKNFKPKDTKLSTALCGNYIDLHLDAHLKTRKGSKEAVVGSVYSMEYDLGVFGDDTLTRKRVAKIGKASMKANKIVIPKEE